MNVTWSIYIFYWNKHGVIDHRLLIFNLYLFCIIVFDITAIVENLWLIYISNNKNSTNLFKSKAFLNLYAKKNITIHYISKNILFVWIGSVGNIHLTCLERWINECGIDRCELCLFQFTSDQTRRYTVWQSLVVWMRNPVHRSLLISDSIVMVVLTIVMTCLITSVVMGMTVFSTSKTDR